MITLVAECLGKKTSFPLTEGAKELDAGSLPENEIYLPFKGVSRKHFRIYRASSSWMLKDLGSRNGTFVNGKKVTVSPVHAGDTILAGVVQITLQAIGKKDDEEVIPLPGDETDFNLRDTGETPPEMDFAAFKGEANLFYFPKLVYPDEMIPGISAGVFEVFNTLHSIVDSDVNVLLVGETGVGKEMFAETIHLSSKRSKGPFITVNCAAIQAELAESELFGIGEKVATDVGKRTGFMALADGGTLFLDELSAFPFPLQAKILRAVEEKMILPVGEKIPVQADFRIVSTSNEDPKELIQLGRLREDLYHRLATVEVRIPPLRERKEDIEPLTLGILKQLCRKEKKNIPGLKKSVLERLRIYDYPGNVRELTNILKAMMAIAHSGEVLSTELLPERVLKGGRSTGRDITEQTVRIAAPLREAVDDITKDMIIQALRLHQGNVSKAARHLKISARGMRKMMQRLQIPSPRSETAPKQ